jgi:hypothetical protein
MMQDYIRTSTYQRAILDNSVDFAGKVCFAIYLPSHLNDFISLGRT